MSHRNMHKSNILKKGTYFEECQFYFSFTHNKTILISYKMLG